MGRLWGSRGGWSGEEPFLGFGKSGRGMEAGERIKTHTTINLMCQNADSIDKETFCRIFLALEAEGNSI